MLNQLHVYYDSKCSTAFFTQELIHSVRNHHQGSSIEIVDLNAPDIQNIQIPEFVFAVPAYILNGSTIFVGNPTRQALLERLNTN
jgi:hypothetical protein